MIYQSSSSAETKTLGGEFATKLIARPLHRSRATIVALRGDLGAGKTTFTQGFLHALGIRSHITSPTFVLMKIYKIKDKGLKIKNVFHMDWYRLHSQEELSALSFSEILKDPQNIVLVEWPERIPSGIPKSSIHINFNHGQSEEERSIEIKKL